MAWFAALVIAGACTAGVDKLTGPSSTDDAQHSSIPSSPGVVISQVYGGGGNSNAKYINDYVELYNPGAAPVVLDGWSIQYNAAGSAAWSGKTNLTGTIQPGHYFLVQEASNANVGVAFPLPADLIATSTTGSINLSGTSGKVALVSSTTTLPALACATGSTVVDFVGYGAANCAEGGTPTAVLTSQTAAFRNGGGNTDTDNNGADFTVAAANPRNSSVGGTVIVVPLDHVTITGGATTVPAGSTVSFTAAALSADNQPASSPTITWTSSDPSIATVDNTGKVTGVVASVNVVTLTATAVANGVTRTATTPITVTSPLGSSGVVISQVYGGGGNGGSTLHNDFIELYNAGNQPVSVDGWSVQYSSPTTSTWTATPLAGVIQPGGYYLVQEGAGSTAGGGTDPLPTPDATGTIGLGATAGKVALARTTSALSGCPLPTDASLADLVGFGTTANCFEGSAPTAATTNSTAAIRKGAGNIDTGDNAADFDVGTPTPRNSASPRNVVAGPLDHVTITGASSVATGATTQLTAAAQDVANITVLSAKITWTSSDPSTATVDNTGKVSGVVANATPVVITATAVANGITKTATKSVTVTPPTPVATVTVSPTTWSLKAGQTKTLTASALDAANNPTSTTYTWSSANPNIATVDPTTGLVTAKTIGDVVITATSANNVKGSATITVLSAANVTITNGKTALALGMQTQFFYGGTDASNNPVTSVVWSSSDPSIVTVDQHGVATGKSLGVATLRATAPDGSFGTTRDSIYLAAGATGLRLGHNTEFGEPKDADPSDDILIKRAQYTVSYNPSRGGANWVSWNLDRTHVGANGRCPGTCYSADTALTNLGITAYTTADWVSGNTYDRGHMSPSADWTSSEADNNTTFFLSNFLPQTHDMNAGPWEKLENALRDSVAGGREAYLIAGGVFQNGVGLGTISGLGKIAIPNSTWKIAVITPAGTGINPDGTLPPNTTVLAVDMPNITGIANDPFEKYLTTVDKIQQETGYDFLALLSEPTQCHVEVRNCTPTARVTGAGLAGGNEGQTLSFSASTSTDPDASDVLSYSWTVDGQPVGSSATLDYTFANDGAYKLRLYANDGHGGIDSVLTTVNIANVAPTVAALAGATIDEGSAFTSTGTFTDPGADSWTATVDYGDGSGVQPLSLAGKSFALNHVYAADGSYTVTVSINDGATAGTATATVTVRNVAPTVNSFSGASLSEGSTYNTAGAFADPGADTWTATVDYGDGSGVQPLALAGKSFTLGHTYADNGAFTVTVTVRDADGGVGTMTAVANVSNVAPVVGALAGATIMRGETYATAGSFTDPGADTWSATVNYGEGATSSLPLSAKSFALSHAFTTTGIKTVTVTVTDDDNGVGTGTAQVVVLTGAQSIDLLASQVASLTAAGRMTAQDSKFIANKLDVARQELAKGNTRPALNQLNDVLARIAAASSGGTLTAADADALTAYVNRIIASLS